jgi:GMP synthase-like glutamine amidotransferase
MLMYKPCHSQHLLTNNHRGICYGCQELAWRIDKQNVAGGQKREYGETQLSIKKVGGDADRLFEGFGDSMQGAYRLSCNKSRLPILTLNSDHEPL